MIAAPLEFWQEIILQLVGPVTTAIVGTLIVGLIAGLVTRNAQERHVASDLRNDLISDMTETASSLYIQTQDYWRKKGQQYPNLGDEKKSLDDRYKKSRVSGEVLQQRLRAYFGENEPSADAQPPPAPSILWHSTIDLLTVRYFDLIDRATDQLLERNSIGFEGKYHSGLTVEQLKEDKQVLRAYEQRLAQATDAVLTTRLRD